MMGQTIKMYNFKITELVMSNAEFNNTMTIIERLYAENDKDTRKKDLISEETENDNKVLDRRPCLRD